MKVMHFHFGKDGGAERFFVQLVNAFARREVQQQAVIRKKRIWRSEIEQSAEITENNFRDASIHRLLLPLQVKKNAQIWKPDAMFAWMPWACKLMPKYSECIRIARLGDYPVNLTKFRHIDTLVCNTPGIAEHVKQLGWTRPVQVISNFTNPVLVKPSTRQELDTPEDVPLIVSIGRFVPRKGFDVLIKALAQMEDAYLWLVGDGEQCNNLKELANQLGVAKRVRFVGWKADPRPYVAAADVFAMASNHEPLGNVVLEAWAQQVPVVSTRSEGPSWFMQDQQNGLMVDIGDVEGFVNAFETILGNRSLQDEIVQGGLYQLENLFSEKAVVDAYLKLFSEGVSPAQEYRPAA